MLVVAICLYRLAQRHAASSLWSFVIPLLVFGAAVPTLRAAQLRMVQRPEPRGPTTRPGLVQVLVAVVLLLSTIGMLLRISLGAHGMSTWSEPLVAAAALLLLFATAEVARRSKPGGFLPWALVAAGLLLAACQAVIRGRLATVVPGIPSLLDWPTSLLAFTLLGLVALALTRRPPGPERWLARRLKNRELQLPWAAVPVLAALSLLAYTASLSAAVALFAGGMGVLARTGGATGSGEGITDREPRSGRLARPVRTGLACVAGFGAGACVIALAGVAFGIRGFSHVKMLAGPATDPYALFFHYPYLFGPGWQMRTQGIDRRLGAGQVILSAIGREVGVAGLLGLLALFIVLLGALLWLGWQQQRKSFGSAWMFGLASFLGAQFLIAVLRLLRWPSLYATGPPLLAGGIAWYIATLIAVGVAIGCAARPTGPSEPLAQRQAEMPTTAGTGGKRGAQITGAR
jgi:hypothetical protein